MNVSIGEHWEKFVETAVREGRYGSASEVVREGLRLVEEREAKLKVLREEINAGNREWPPLDRERSQRRSRRPNEAVEAEECVT